MPRVFDWRERGSSRPDRSRFALRSVILGSLAAMHFAGARSFAVDQAVVQSEAQRIAVVAKVTPAVVAIFAPGGGGGGSGVLITPDGFALTLTDETGMSARAELPHAKEPAKDAERALAGLRDGIAKLGATIFSARDVQLELSQAWFLPAGAVNALRREAADKLEAARINALPPLPRRAAVEPPVPYPETELSYLANVLNQKARDFYHRHGVQLIEAAYEANEHTDDASLMISKHCLRYSFNLCPKEVKGIKPDPMTLINGKETLTLKFDCKRCEMHVIGRIRKSVLDMPAVPIQFHASRPAQFQAPH